MANAAVLKTADRKVLQVRILCPPLRARVRAVARALVPALTVVVLALALVPVTARSACACSIKHPAYRVAMQSDLRNLLSAQEGVLSDSGRYLEIDRLVAMGRFRFSTSVHLVESRVSGRAFSARVRHDQLAADVTCSVAVDDGTPSSAEPSCSRFPRERAHVRNGIIFLAVLAIALVLRAGAAAARQVRFFSGRLLLLPALAIAHPFWDVIDGRVIDHCFLTSWDFAWIGIAAAAAIYRASGPAPPQTVAVKPAAG